MDPDRHLPIPGRKHPRNPPPMIPPSAPDSQARSIPPSAATYQQPSLPSIRQLHPYLPPSGVTQPSLSAQETQPYSYSAPGPYAGPSGSADPHPIQSLIPQNIVYPRSEGVNSEPEGEAEQQGPAKKKRRRQALSCNECKRRKIKCDRAQPCGPCTRRGEQSKCQWRTLEPVDKYVTRAEYDELKSRSKAEYDELKARLDRLETLVERIYSAPSGAVNVSLYSMSPDMSGGAPPSENISYHAGHGSTGPILYSPAVAPSSYQADPVPKPPQYPSNSPHLVTSGTLPLAATSPQPPPRSGGGGGSSHVRRASASDSKSPTAVRQSPLSLASITYPFNTDAAQSKNYHAQTLNLPGVRLRPVPLPLLRDGWNGLATAQCATPHRWRWNTHSRQQRRVSRMLPWKDRRELPWHSTYQVHRGAGDMETRR